MTFTTEPPERQRSFTSRDLRRFLGALLLLVAAATAAVLLDFVPTSPGYQIGDIAPAGGIHAPHAAVIPNDVETEQARQAARDTVSTVYDYTPAKAAAIAEEQISTLRDELSAVDDAMRPSVAPEARKIALQTAVATLPNEARPLIQSLDPTRWDAVRTAAIAVLDSAERPELKDADLRGRKSNIAALYMPSGLTVQEQQLVVALVAPLLVPNSFPSDQLTQEARDAAAANVPQVKDTIQAGQVIVDGGHPITAADMIKIKGLGLDSSQLQWGIVGAWILLNALVVALLLAWLWRYRPEYWHRGRTLLLVGLIFAVAMLAIRLTAGRSTLPYVLPAPAAGMLLAVLLDPVVAIVMAGALGALAGTAAGGSLELAVYVLFGSFAGIMAIRKGDRLHYFIEAGIAIAAVDVVIVAVFTMLGQHDPTGLLQLWAAAAAASVLSAVVTLGSFAVLGNVFGILTGWQLLELANPSQPLLRRLLMETPGTYHHALMVGNLAERAAAAIGADPLLTRVAAYYHDVGKLGNPAAFIENQASGENIHDQLLPEDSAAILKQHVPDGIELAYRANLPKPLIAFIPQHHGTALLSYFYAKAREVAAGPFGGLQTAAGAAAADGIDQRRFRHSGPKPQSKEAAILMLADGVEASVRSLASRDEASIRAMVGRIIDERLQDGQLDECNLTIRDLEQVREAFVEQLLGMYHQRIEYPQNKIVELESRRERGLG